MSNGFGLKTVTPFLIQRFLISGRQGHLGGCFFVLEDEMRGLLALMVTSLILGGCTSSNIQTYASIDQRAKTVTVPAGSGGLKGDLKKALSERGWKMSVYSGPEVLEGSSGKNMRLQRYDTFNTRYSLLVGSRQFDVCLNFSPAINYEISLIDNKSGSEVITMDGRDCQNAIVSKFMNALENQEDKK